MEKKHTIKAQQITITDPYVANAKAKLVTYLLTLETEKFLYEIYQVAGLTPLTENGYAGWERSDAVNFRGHFFGHYLSALALAYATEKNEEKRRKLFEHMEVGVAGLKAAQSAYAKIHPESAGYVSAFREVALDEVEGRPVAATEKENVLVPWYDLHKILAGLLEISEQVPKLSADALAIAAKFGDYVYQRMCRLDDQEQMLKIEYGGMNDALYHLYLLTGDVKHAQAAHFFDEENLFTDLAEGRDVLAGKHANTTIPKFIGAMRHFQVSQDQRYLKAAENFWDIVVADHSYCTGGNSQSEHFHEAGKLAYDAHIRNGDCTCETCNTHNMLKLSKMLYAATDDPTYLNYYEQTYINAILASQNPETGMMMYFQPMGAGYNKVYNRPFDEFWCCTGTGIESFAKLADTYFYQTGTRVDLNLYFSSEVALPDLGLRLSQVVDRKKMQVTVKIAATRADAAELTLGFRLPTWSKGYVVSQPVHEENGFAIFDEVLKAGDARTIAFQPELKLAATADDPNYAAVTYGPYVLAADLGATAIDADAPNGILVRVGTKEALLPDTIFYETPEWREHLAEQFTAVEVAGKTVAFQSKNTTEPLVFSPYYEMHGRRYGLYFKFVAAGSAEASKILAEKEKWVAEQTKVLASLTNFDENNSEYAQNLQYEHAEIGHAMGRRFRQAQAGGWFSYRFDLHNKAAAGVHLFLTFHGEDAGKIVAVTVGKTTQKVVVENRAGFFDQIVPLAIDTKAPVAICLAAQETDSPRIFGITFSK